MVVSYTNNYGYTDAYANKGFNNITTNGDGGGNGGGGAFMKMFEEQETEDSKKEDETSEESSNPLDDIYGTAQYYAGQNVIRDYIDNSLLLNTEQVACTNLTQHLVLRSNVKETLKFLNIQAAKNMVNSRKYNYSFQTTPQIKPAQQTKTVSKEKTSNAPSINFFEKGSLNKERNFFIN